MTEQTLAAAIEAKGRIMLSRPRGQYKHPTTRHFWGVYVGSHGGHGTTLIKAIRSCLMCCGLGDWWHVDGVESELLRDWFDRECRVHLGRGIYRKGKFAPSPATFASETNKDRTAAEDGR